MKNMRMLDAVIAGSVSGALMFLGLVALIVVGIMSGEDNVTEQNLYCAMVFEQTYPDYKGTFEKDCAEWLTEHDKSVN